MERGECAWDDTAAGGDEGPGCCADSVRESSGVMVAAVGNGNPRVGVENEFGSVVVEVFDGEVLANDVPEGVSWWLAMDVGGERFSSDVVDGDEREGLFGSVGGDGGVWLEDVLGA